MRIYDPSSHGATPLSFRSYGPLHRFDHHQHPGGSPGVDADRAIIYGGFTLSCCVVEVFGDSGIIDPRSKCVAILNLLRPLTLIDLRGSGAMRAGTVAAISKEADRDITQQWSRHFYYKTAIYGTADGIIFFNARNAHNNDEEAVALFERSKSALTFIQGNSIELRDKSIKTELQHIAFQNNLLVPPY
jgi:hypothetical protein